MKTVAFICLLLLAGTAWAGDREPFYPPPGPDGRLPMTPGDLMMPPRVFRDTPETRERLIREWAASGEVCRVLGHRWKYLHVIIPTGEIRECSICGKTETKREVWE